MELPVVLVVVHELLGPITRRQEFLEAEFVFERIQLQTGDILVIRLLAIVKLILAEVDALIQGFSAQLGLTLQSLAIQVHVPHHVRRPLEVFLRVGSVLLIRQVPHHRLDGVPPPLPPVFRIHGAVRAVSLTQRVYLHLVPQPHQAPRLRRTGPRAHLAVKFQLDVETPLLALFGVLIVSIVLTLIDGRNLGPRRQRERGG